MTTRLLPPSPPMLAAKATDTQIQKLFDTTGVLIGSPKLDGIRCTIQEGGAYSKSLKLIRNKHVQNTLPNLCVIPTTYSVHYADMTVNHSQA